MYVIPKKKTRNFNEWRTEARKGGFRNGGSEAMG
jgi:hypothetical protein